METSETFSCQRQDCPRDRDVKGTCSLCEMPSVDSDVVMVMTLYKRCKAWKCLPLQGGLMDQNETLMSLLDVVEDEVERQRATRLKEEQMNMEKQRMLQGI